MGTFFKFIARLFQGWKGRVGILTLMLALMLVVGWVRGQSVSDKMQVVSCGSELSADDVEKFRPERSMDDILKDLNWRGNFELATVFQDGEVAAISYEVFGNMFSQDPRQAILWAIFINGKFEKFVEYPKGDRLPIKLGTFDRLTRAKGSPPLDMAKLMKEPKPKDRSDGDYGLMIAVAPFIPFILTKQLLTSNNTTRNAELRNQYNASRLKLGMAEEDVDTILRAEPLEFGVFDGGSWKIYGSSESFTIPDDLHYSNILVLFRDGTVSGIYSGPTIHGGAAGLRSLRESTVMRSGAAMKVFADLPHATRK